MPCREQNATVLLRSARSSRRLGFGLHSRMFFSNLFVFFAAIPP